jgi:hypothetical protein
MQKYKKPSFTIPSAGVSFRFYRSFAVTPESLIKGAFSPVATSHWISPPPHDAVITLRGSAMSVGSEAKKIGDRIVKKIKSKTPVESVRYTSPKSH